MQPSMLNQLMPAIRIRSKWDNHIAFGITKELFEIYDRIAGHIKSV